MQIEIKYCTVCCKYLVKETELGVCCVQNAIVRHRVNVGLKLKWLNVIRTIVVLDVTYGSTKTFSRVRGDSNIMYSAPYVNEEGYIEARRYKRPLDRFKAEGEKVRFGVYKGTNHCILIE